MKFASLAISALAISAFIGGTAAAQATMTPIANPPAKPMAHGHKHHGKHHHGHKAAAKADAPMAK